MSVLLETTAGDIIVDVNYKRYKVESYNFLKLCACNFYQNQCFYNLYKGQQVQFGNPLIGYEDRKELRFTNTSIEGIDGEPIRPRFLKSSESLRHSGKFLKGSLGYVTVQKHRTEETLIGSQICIILSDHEASKHTANFLPFADVISASWSTLDKISYYAIDATQRPLEDIRVRSTHIIYDPFFDDKQFPIYQVSLPIQNVRLPPSLMDPYTEGDPEICKDIRRKELSLEVIEETPIIAIDPSPRVLFVCKLNPLTKAEDLAIIFHKFGDIVAIEIVRDKFTGRSLGYGFVEFTEKKSCEQAYKKMEGVIIDDRIIHVDFSQSVKRARRLPIAHS